MRTEFREGDHIKILLCFLPGSNRRPCACEAHVITATLRKLHRHLLSMKGIQQTANSKTTIKSIEPKNSIIPSGDRTQDLWIRSPTRYPLR